MASTQMNLHKYFIATKKNKSVQGKDIKGNSNNILKKDTSKDQILRKSKLTKESKKSHSILSYLERIPDGADVAGPSNAPRGTPQVSTTPKRKLDTENAPERKRKRIQEDEEQQITDNLRTPVKTLKGKATVATDVKKSAKKIIFSDETKEDNKKLDDISNSGHKDAESTARKLHLESPRKMNLQEVKERLGKCNKLADLRARLLKLNQCEERIKEFKSAPLVQSPKKEALLSPTKMVKTPRKALFTTPEGSHTKSPRGVPPSPHKLSSVHPQLEHFEFLEFIVPDISPLKSPRKLQSPQKSPSPHKSCFQRFHHLTEAPTLELSLPVHYQFIKEVFRAVDTVVSMLHNRHELITFAKLKSAVREMLRKALYEKHLGQIKSVFPLAYFFKREKLKTNNSGGSESQYQLTLSPNMNYKNSTEVSANLMSRFEDNPSTATTFRKMDSVVLVERRRIMHESLVEILKQHHTEFLKTLDPPITLTGPLKRWHPEFPIEEVGEPTAAPLPLAPDETIPTVKDLLDKARDVLFVNNRMKVALEKAAALQSPPINAEPQNKAPPTANAANDNISAALKGVSLSLLEKIRAKEAAKATREMTRSTSQNKELEMLSRLPEIARILRNVFVTEKKNTIAWDVLLTKIKCSYSSILISSEVSTHLNLLIKEVPGWCTIHKVRGGTYIKMDKNRQLQEVTETLQKIIKDRS